MFKLALHRLFKILIFQRHLLNRHIKLKHTEKERTHSCSTCNKSFFTISTLKKHIESHRAKDMPCEFCGKLFSCMNNLRTHLYYHQDPKFECEFQGCGKKFFMRKLLRAHMNVIIDHLIPMNDNRVKY